MVNYKRKATSAVSRYKPVAKRARVYYPAVRQLASDVMYVKSLINSEPKNHIVQSQANFTFAGAVVSLSSVPQGSDSFSRDGDRILPRYLSFRCHVNGDNAGAMHKTIRVVIFRWWGESANATGVSPSSQDILGSVSTPYAPLSHLNTEITGPRGDRQRRIEVHYSKQFTFDNVGTTFMDVS